MIGTQAPLLACCGAICDRGRDCKLQTSTGPFQQSYPCAADLDLRIECRLSLSDFGVFLSLGPTLARERPRAPECELVFGISGRPREGNCVAHVGQARDVGDGAFKAQAKTRVRHRTVAAQISVPAVMLFVDAAFRHACI